MARGGINKALVQQARESLLSKGQNPSIDAVRIALGNTGSKSTIHRYLKELEEEENTQLNDEALLSRTIKDQVVKLASSLREEAQSIVDQAEERHRKQLAQLDNRLKEQIERFTQAQHETQSLEDQLSEAYQELTDTKEALRSRSEQYSRMHQQLEDQEALLGEKDAHIRSLEEKHQHARESLQHYRESVKEQRDQDQRRHEQHVQQLQAEQRQLQQSISIKQSEITQLNKDNAQLAAQLRETRKQLSEKAKQWEQVSRDLKLAEEKVGWQATHMESLTHQVESLPALQRDNANQEKTIHALELKITALQTELTTKNELFTKLGLTKRDAEGD